MTEQNNEEKNERERRIEHVSCTYAKKLGWEVYKFTSPGRNGVPDRIFIKSGAIFMVEFKSKSGALSAVQKVEHAILKQHRIIVMVMHDSKSFIKFIDNLDKAISRNSLCEVL